MNKQDWEEFARLCNELKPRVEAVIVKQGTDIAKMTLDPREKERLGKEVYRKIARGLLELENLDASDRS
jgi:hypothetical protein